MDSPSIDIKEHLRLEQWKGKGIGEITINDFKTLDRVIDQMESEEDADEVLTILEEQLEQTPQNVSALYGVSLIKLKRKSVDDSQLISLLDIFRNGKRWGLLEHLCVTFLQYGQSRQILRILANCYSETSEAEKQIGIWEELVKIDFTETDMVLGLAEEYMKRGQQGQAIEFYKKLILRSISNGSFSMVHTGWNALVTLLPGDIEFFLHSENNVSKKFDGDQSVLLLEQLYPIYKKESQWDRAITILKRIFEYQPDNMWARKELVVCYSAKYHAHRNLDEFLKSANINQSWRSIHEAIADFEKHVSFDEKNFVFHRTWGVGVIRNIDHEAVLIDFSRNKQHYMSLKMAMTALEVLPKSHIWVLRSVIPQPKLKQMVKKNIAQTLRLIIQSFGNAVSMKKIRSELVPYVLTDSEWTGWNIKARRILKTDGMFGTVADLSDHYEVRTQQSTSIEKVYNSFSAAKDFATRTKTILDFLKLSDIEVSDADLELLRDVSDYFVTFIDAGGRESGMKVSSILILRLLDEKFPPLQLDDMIKQRRLDDFIKDDNTAFVIYQQIETKEMFQFYLLTISEELAEDIWVGVYFRILATTPTKAVLGKLVQRGKIEETVEIIRKVYMNYRTHREAFVWLVANMDQYEELVQYFPDHDKVTIAMAHLYDINATDITNKRHLSANRKNQKQIQKYLYRTGRLDQLVEDGTEDVIVQLIPILNELQQIEPAQTISQKEIINTRFPSLVGRFDRQVGVHRERKKSGFFTLAISYHAKQRALRHIHEVEVPLNSKEIQKALELGDLRENAEYKSAKEHQEILNANAMRLDNEIRQAKIMHEEQFEDDNIGFGSMAALTDMNNDSKIDYVILGPWESDPGKSIISYLSPLGAKLIGHTVGEEMDFSINETHYHFRVEKITTIRISDL